MQEVNILYGVTAVVVVALVVWVLAVLATAKEPWGRTVRHVEAPPLPDEPPLVEAPIDSPSVSATEDKPHGPS